MNFCIAIPFVDNVGTIVTIVRRSSESPERRCGALPAERPSNGSSGASTSFVNRNTAGLTISESISQHARGEPKFAPRVVP